MQFLSQMQNAERSVKSQTMLDLKNTSYVSSVINVVHLDEHLEFSRPKMVSVNSSRKILDFRKTDSERIWNELRNTQ